MDNFGDSIGNFPTRKLLDQEAISCSNTWTISRVSEYTVSADLNTLCELAFNKRMIEALGANRS